MGNTVLTFLRKAKHPNVVNFARKQSAHKWYSHWSPGRSNMMVRIRTNGNVEFILSFKDYQDKYTFTLTPSHFSMIHHRPEKFYDYVGYKMPTAIKVAELIELPYNDFESMIFQQSLLGDLGMFGADEAFALYKLRNIYFGECN